MKDLNSFISKLYGMFLDASAKVKLLPFFQMFRYYVYFNIVLSCSFNAITADVSSHHINVTAWMIVAMVLTSLMIPAVSF